MKGDAILEHGEWPRSLSSKVTEENYNISILSRISYSLVIVHLSLRVPVVYEVHLHAVTAEMVLGAAK